MRADRTPQEAREWLTTKFGAQAILHAAGALGAVLEAQDEQSFASRVRRVASCLDRAADEAQELLRTVEDLLDDVTGFFVFGGFEPELGAQFRDRMALWSSLTSAVARAAKEATARLPPLAGHGAIGAKDGARLHLDALAQLLDRWSVTNDRVATAAWIEVAVGHRTKDSWENRKARLARGLRRRPARISLETQLLRLAPPAQRQRHEELAIEGFKWLLQKDPTRAVTGLSPEVRASLAASLAKELRGQGRPEAPRANSRRRGRR